MKRRKKSIIFNLRYSFNTREESVTNFRKYLKLSRLIIFSVVVRVEESSIVLSNVYAVEK